MFWKAGWILWILYFAVLETAAILSKQPDATLSAQVRDLRFTDIGRPLTIILWCWLTYHWMLRPHWDKNVDKRDLYSIALGVVWSVAEILKTRKSKETK